MLELAQQTFFHFAAACQAKAITFVPTWYKYLDSETIAGKCSIKFTFPDDLGKIGLALVEILLTLGAIVAVFFIIYGGFQFLLSQGEPDKIAAARQGILNAVIGLVLSMLATAIVTFVGNQLI